ncbi:MAG: carbohydrate ABC transporter permease [Chloroflexota bacterium]
MAIAFPLRRRRRVTIGSTRVKKEPIGIYAVLIPLSVLAILPIIFMASQALKPIDELLKFPPDLIVQHPTLINFQNLLIATSATSVPFTRYIFNSAWVTVVQVIVGVLIGSLCAYPLAKINVPGSRLIMALIIAALAFPAQVLAIPNYLVVSSLHMVDTYWALIIPALGTSFNVFVMVQFMSQIPTPLLEAAKMDGATEWTIFWRLVVPMVRPAIATIAFLTFTAAWNASGPALIYVRTESMRTLPLAIATLGAQNNIATIGIVQAASLLQFIPSLIIFLISRSGMLEALAHTGIKG